MSEWKKVAYCDEGYGGTPGTGYTVESAKVFKKDRRWKLVVVLAWGSNQGYHEEHSRIEREYRANSLEDLMCIGISEVRLDGDLKSSKDNIVSAIRKACFEAEDDEE